MLSTKKGAWYMSTQKTSDTPHTHSVLEWLKSYWFLFAFLVASGAVYGQYAQKVERLEDAVKSWSTKEEQVQKLRSQVDVLDDRTKRIMETQEQQSKDIQTLIILQQKTLSTTRAIRNQ
jgi:hypothetical protein